MHQYGLQAAFKEIERLHHEVTDGGNPIGLDLKTRYVVKGIGKEQTIASKVNIFYDKDSGKITKVEDKWDGQLPDSSFTNVSVGQILSPWWWMHYGEGWAWWMWSFTWQTRPWQVGVRLPHAESTMASCYYSSVVIADIGLCRYSVNSTP